MSRSNPFPGTTNRLPWTPERYAKAKALLAEVDAPKHEFPEAELIRDLNMLAAAHASGPNDDGHVIAQAAAKIVELRAQINALKNRS